MTNYSGTQRPASFQTMRSRPDFEAQKRAAHAYAERCRQLANAGLKPVVISKREEPTHWRDWRDYYRNHGLLASLDLMDQGTTKTVPTRSPFEFEAVPDRRMVD